MSYNKKVKKLFLIAVLVAVFYSIGFTPIYAQVGVNVCPATEPGATICQALGQDPDAFSRLIQFAITTIFIIAILITIFVLIGGFALANGGKNKSESARHAITAAVIGLVIVLVSFVIINVISLVFGIPLFSFLIPRI